jgi:RIO kinase 1
MRQDQREQLEWWSQLDEAGEGVGWRPAPKARPARPKRSLVAARSELAGELYQPEAEYNFTYRASRHERAWISTSLQHFYDDDLISDVLQIVKGGKEANVYCCQAFSPELSPADSTQPEAGELDLLAAKVYRPRTLRSLKNDAVYKEGRPVLDEQGKARRDARSARAIAKKTRIGSEMTITSWIEYEFQTMRRLYRAGADVPKPVAQFGNAILMDYIGELANPAPPLSDVTLDREEARPLFDRLLKNVALMLENHLVHADLSAYNVLYWEGSATIIDFPQVVDPLGNRRGFDLLLRDIERLCQYFARYGVRSNPRLLAGELWNRYEREVKY